MGIRLSGHRTLEDPFRLDRRDFFKAGGAAGASALLASRTLFGQNQNQTPPAKPTPSRPKTNFEETLKVPKTKYSLPGLFPGKVVEVQDEKSLVENKPDPGVVRAMFEKGISRLTGKNPADSFRMFFSQADVVGIKVNPAGGKLISTSPEVVDCLVSWLEKGGIPRRNIIIWDRFDYMLTDAGFTADRFPGVGLEGLQTMDESAAEGKTQDNSKWLRPDGTHVSADNFDKDVYYWVDIEGPKDMAYLNQHVFNGKYSYFGKLVTKKLTKIINVPVFKNAGNAVAMASKNMGFGAVCNTNRLHQPIYLDVCVEVLGFPAVRDKYVLTVTDGLRGQYDGGTAPNAKFIYPLKTLFFATDPFAVDMYGHNKIVEKRKSMNVAVNENPRFTEYLRYAERLGLGLVDPAKTTIVRA
jgi:hypothetical protein